MLIPKHCYSLHKSFTLQEDTCAPLRHAYTTTPTSVYHKNKQKETYHLQSWDLKSFFEDGFYNLSRKPWRNMENTLLKVKKQILQLKGIKPIYCLFSNWKKCLCYAWEKAENRAEFTHSMFYMSLHIDGFK